MDPALVAVARAIRGFMPEDEGLALHRAALAAAETASGPLLEVGTYCGKSAVYLGSAAKEAGMVLYTVDHHRGSEENQPGWEHHDPELVNPATGRMDTLAHFRRTMEQAGLEEWVVAVVGESSAVSAHWRTPLSLVFIDGGHGREPAWADYLGWAPHVAVGGLLAIHDVFADPNAGGRPPYELWCRAVTSGAFTDVVECGSLRVLRRVAPGV